MAVTSAVAAVGGTLVSAGSAMAGSGAQQDAADSANDTQKYMYQQMRNDLLPYMQTGQSANTALANATGINTDNPLASPLLKPISVDQETLEKTPGYQFNRQQGLKSVQNSAAARGLGVSGAAQKAAANYATGLADSTYQNQFNNALTNQQNQFKNLLGLSELGQTSAAGVGSAGITTGNNIASNTIGAGNAAASGYLGAGNALNNGYSNYVGNNALSGLYGNTGGGSNFNYNNLGANVNAPSANITWN